MISIGQEFGSQNRRSESHKLELSGDVQGCHCNSGVVSIAHLPLLTDILTGSNREEEEEEEKVTPVGLRPACCGHDLITFSLAR